MPDDSALIGFDENRLNDWIAPWLSSVRVPYEAFGAAIAAFRKSIWGDASGDCDV